MSETQKRLPRRWEEWKALGILLFLGLLVAMVAPFVIGIRKLAGVVSRD